MVGGAGLWSVVVVLPAVEAEFDASRADASLPYTLTMIGFAVGGIVMGRFADRFGIVIPLAGGTVSLVIGYIAASMAPNIWFYAVAHGVFVGFLGSSATFGPLIADISHWFNKHRGIAIAVAASGSYLAGTVWPPIVQYLVEEVGWRDTHLIIGAAAFIIVLPLSFLLRRKSPAQHATSPAAQTEVSETGGISPPMLQGLLMFAGLACCIAMAMPQVHIVAYCVDLGYGTGNGAKMLSLMLATGIVSRLGFGWISDQIGPLKTLLISSGLQGLSMLFFLPFDGLVSLYLVSAMFGLAQGGIVPTYAVVIRTYFPASEAGMRIGMVLSATLVGMAVGGWMSGAIYDLTLSYNAAFLNGILWNVANLAVAIFFLIRLAPPVKEITKAA